MNWKFIAIFLSILVISMPFVFATSLNIQEASGSDGVRNFYKRDDTVTIKALANVDGEREVENDQLRVYIDNENVFELFQSCTQFEGSFYECVYERALHSSTGSHTYRLELYSDRDKFKDDVRPLRKVTETLTVDVLPADVLDVNVVQEQTGSETIAIKITAEDYAETKGDTSSCSGIRELQILENGVQTSSIVPESFSCTYSELVQHPTNVTGDIEVCVRAVDGLGQTGMMKCDSVSVDRGPPVVTLVLKDGSGEVQDFVNPSKSYTVDVIATIEDDSVDDDSVRGTFSKLTSSSAFVDKKYSRREGEDYIWTGLPMDKFEACEVTLPVKDTLGNIAPQPIVCNTQVDTVAPSIVSLGTNAPTTGMLGSGGEIIATINENGRVAAKDIFLDLSSVTGQGKVAATSCEFSGNWICKWVVNPNRSGSATLSLHPDSTDRAGNSFSNTQDLSVTIDLDSPVLNSVKMQVAGRPADVVAAGDAVEFILDVENAVLVEADLSSTGGGIVDGTCDGSTCRVMGSIGADVTGSAEVEFTLISSAGSRVTTPYNVNLHTISEEEKDLWDISVECMPNLVDRSTAELINHRVYCHIKLIPKESDAEVVSISMGSPATCEGDLQGNVASLQLGNAVAGTTDPYLQVTLATSDFPDESIEFNCPIHISSKTGNVFYTTPETENVEVEVGFYNPPLGDAYKNLNKKIKDAKDDAEGIWKIIGFLDKLVSYGRMICRLKQIIYNIIYGLDAIVKIFKGIGDVCYVTSPDPSKSECIVLHEMGDATCISKGSIETWFEGGSAGGFFNIADKFCSFINCQMSNPNPSLDMKGIFSTLGGGGIMNYCGDINQYLSDFVGGKGAETSHGGSVESLAIQPISIQDSLVYSILCTCVPGILYNLNKLRQIKCRYAVCLGVDVKEKGIPISACQDENNYLTCNYVFNAVFYLIPFSKLLETFLDTLQEIFKNPFAALSAVAGIICRINCNPTPGTSATYWSCEIPNIISKIGDAIASVVNLFSGDFFEVGNDMCDDLDKIEIEEKEKKETESSKDTRDSRDTRNSRNSKTGSSRASRSQSTSTFNQYTRETREERNVRVQGGTTQTSRGERR